MGNINDKLDNKINDFKQNNLIIILVSQEIIVNSLKIDFVEDNNYNYMHYEIKENNVKNEKELSKKEINFVINLIKENINDYTKRIIFIIFSEYFFSNVPILEDKRDTIMRMISSSFSKFEIFFLYNFLYKLKKPLNKNEIEDLKEYLINANTDNRIFNLNLTNGKNHSLICNENLNNWYTNESVLTYNNKVILTQKKQNFYKEIPLICENFSLGFGGKEAKINSLEPEIKLYQYFKDFFNIDICMDAQHGFSFKRENYMKNDISYLSKEDQDIIQRKRKVFKKYYNGEDYNKKDYYIIQSNSTDLSDILHHYPENKIIIQVDPNSSGIFCTKYSKSVIKKLEDLNNIKDKYVKNIKEIFEKDINKKENNILHQKKEYYRAKKCIEEIFYRERKDLINRNFYNIVERVKPIKDETKEMENIRINIQLYDLNNLKK